MNSLIIFGAKYLIFVLILLALGAFWKLSKSKQKQMFFLTIIALPLSYVLAKIASLLYFDPRPFVSDGVRALIPHVADNGFPSDHTLLSSAVAAVIFAFNKKFGYFLFLLAILVGASRVLAGVHHWVDILASLVIATVATFVCWKYFLPRLVKAEK